MLCLEPGRKDEYRLRTGLERRDCQPGGPAGRVRHSESQRLLHHHFFAEPDDQSGAARRAWHRPRNGTWRRPGGRALAAALARAFAIDDRTYPRACQERSRCPLCWTRRQTCPALVSRTTTTAAPGGSVGHFEITAGTIGAIARDKKTGRDVILSNNHVLANENAAKIGDAILQAGVIDGRLETRQGRQAFEMDQTDHQRAGTWSTRRSPQSPNQSISKRLPTRELENWREPGPPLFSREWR